MNNPEVQTLTRRQSAILSAFTGVLCGPFEALQEYAEELTGELAFTHYFGTDDFSDKLKELSKEDFLSIINKG